MRTHLHSQKNNFLNLYSVRSVPGTKGYKVGFPIFKSGHLLTRSFEANLTVVWQNEKIGECFTRLKKG